MEDNKYLISGRFLIDLQRNCVKDVVRGIEHRLEPRLMAVLFELLKNPETVVARESLIQKIWNDYPGAEEGLNQAISSLRKFLADDAKEVIKTIPKKGYMLTAPVVKQSHTADVIGKRRNNVIVYAVAVGLAFIIAIGFVWLTVNRKNEPSRASQKKDLEVVFPDVHETDEGDYLNTITTTDSAGNRYRLVMIGDRRPKFYVNDSLQADMEPYTVLIDKLARELWKRQKEAEERYR